MSGSHRGGRRRPHHEEHEEHENHERWLVSYADLVTVLMALFIVMFAISSVDVTKFEALKSSLASSFGSPVVAVAGGRQPGPGTASAEGPLDLGAPVAPTDVAPELSRETVENARERAAADATRAAVDDEVRTMEDARARLTAALERKGLADQVRFRYDERGLVVSIVTDKVIFASDRAELSPVGLEVLHAVGPVLAAVPNGITVEGHTNLVPVKPKYFPSEWELSSARAVAVVRHLVDREGVPAKRLSAVGYADQRPLIPGTGAKANRLNRRVEIVVLSALPPEQRALLPRSAPRLDGPDTSATPHAPDTH